MTKKTTNMRESIVNLSIEIPSNTTHLKNKQKKREARNQSNLPHISNTL